AAASVGLLAGTLVTLALWNTQATLSGPVIATGDLRLAPDSLVWAETTHDVPANEVATGSDLASLAQRHVTPGDSFDIFQGVVVKASGPNLVFDLTVEWEASTTPLAPLQASYALFDSNDQELAKADVGAPVKVTGLTPGEHRFTVSIDLVYPTGLDPVYQAAPGPSGQVAALPTLRISAQQVRGQP
ncbi:MAG: hypothetical protein LBO20_08575, partial [Bifidobacteriaceae bacterium]|nr:hypothetical protein [Bifidobacteriaceae bacterium]